MVGCIPKIPLDPPLSVLISMYLTTTPTSRFGFSMMCDKFCHTCFEITARSRLHLHSLDSSLQKQGFGFKREGGFDSQPPWVRHCYRPSPRLNDCKFGTDTALFYILFSVVSWKLIYCIIVGVPRDFNQSVEQCSSCCSRVTPLDVVEIGIF